MAFPSCDLNIGWVSLCWWAGEVSPRHCALCSSRQCSDASLTVAFISLSVCGIAAPLCVQQRSSHSATRPMSSTTSTVRWWVCLWTLTSPTWRGSTPHARYCPSFNLSLRQKVRGSTRVFFIHPLMRAVKDPLVTLRVIYFNKSIIINAMGSSNCVSINLTGIVSWCFIRLEVWATSTSPYSPTSTSRSLETTGCCWRVRASHWGGLTVNS